MQVMSGKKIKDKIKCKSEAPAKYDRASQNGKEQTCGISRQENEQFWQQKFPNYFSLTNEERKIFRDTLINARKNIELRENIHLTHLGTIHDEVLNLDRKSEILEIQSEASRESKSMESDMENVILESTASDEPCKESSIAADEENSSAMKKISEKQTIHIENLRNEDVQSLAQDHSSDFTFMVKSDLTTHENKADTVSYFAFNNINHSGRESNSDTTIGIDSNIKFIPEKDKESSNTISSNEILPSWKNELAEFELPKFHQLSVEEKTIFFETLKTAYANTVSKEPDKKTDIIPITDVLNLYTKMEGTKSFIMKSNKKDVRVTVEMKIESKDKTEKDIEMDLETTESSDLSLFDGENSMLNDIIRQRMTTKTSPSVQKILQTEDDDIEVVFERKNESNISQELKIESKIQIVKPREEDSQKEKHKTKMDNSESLEGEEIEFKEDNNLNLQKEEKPLTVKRSDFKEDEERKSTFKYSAHEKRISDEEKIAKSEKTLIKEKVANRKKSLIEERILEEKKSVIQGSIVGEKNEIVEKEKAEKKESTDSIIEICTEKLHSHFLLDKVNNETENQIDDLPRLPVTEREFTEISMTLSTDAVQSSSQIAESSKRVNPPKTKIRLLQDLLKDRAVFVKTSTDRLIIKFYPQEAVQEDGSDQQEIITQVEIVDEGVKKGKKKFQWHSLLEKILTCGRKEKGERNAIVENLKGESVPVDLDGKVRDAASATLDSSTMRILQAAKRKRIIQSYIKKR